MFKGEIFDLSEDQIHPRARELLNEAFFWDVSNDFSPHGNDDGADVLSDYAERVAEDERVKGRTFLTEELVDWYGSDWQKLAAEDKNVWRSVHLATIAIAFADVKLRGYCPTTMKDMAIEAMHAILDFDRSHHPKWEHLEEEIKGYALMERVLPKIPLDPSP